MRTLTIHNRPHIISFKRRESASTSITLSSDDMPDAKVRLLNLFTEKSLEYALFIAQCSFVFTVRLCVYAMDQTWLSSRFGSRSLDFLEIELARKLILKFKLELELIYRPSNSTRSSRSNLKIARIAENTRI